MPFPLAEVHLHQTRVLDHLETEGIGRHPAPGRRAGVTDDLLAQFRAQLRHVPCPRLPTRCERHVAVPVTDPRFYVDGWVTGEQQLHWKCDLSFLSYIFEKRFYNLLVRFAPR
jgi:hypothetical protein